MDYKHDAEGFELMKTAVWFSTGSSVLIPLLIQPFHSSGIPVARAWHANHTGHLGRSPNSI